MTIDFHLMWCLYSGWGNMCCHRDASDVCVCGIVAFARRGLTRTVGEDADIGMLRDVSVERRCRYESSRGELPMVLRGECRMSVVPREELTVSSSTCWPRIDLRVGVARIFMGRGVRA